MNLSQAVRNAKIPRSVDRLVPVGFGVVTWLLLTLLGGVLLSADGVSLGLLLIIGGFAILFLPIYRFRPWEVGLASRIKTFVAQNQQSLLLAGGLFILVRIPLVVDQLGFILTVLLLPLRVVPMTLFDAKVYYGTAVSDRFGQAVFTAGRIYIEVLWLYVVGSLVASLLPERRQWP